MADQDDMQQRFKEFLTLLPLTLALAGLPTSEKGYYTEDQIEGRAITVRTAFRIARRVARDCIS